MGSSPSALSCVCVGLRLLVYALSTLYTLSHSIILDEQIREASFEEAN